MLRGFDIVNQLFREELELELQEHYPIVLNLDVPMVYQIQYNKERDMWHCVAVITPMKGGDVQVVREYTSEMVGAIIEKSGYKTAYGYKWQYYEEGK